MPFRRSHRGFSRTRRLYHLLWALFVLVTGATQEGFGLRPCCMHRAMDGGMPTHDMHAMHGMRGMAGMTHGASDPGGRSRSDAPSGNRCVCLGTCQAGGSSIALPSGVTVAQAASVESWTEGPSLGQAWLPRRIPFLIPFPHAPPHLG
ncbi:MAG TPA: hypothetical protein VFL93_04970 [Longimicrobiaceae bacterium]|nr:hypothetical protein [Longimicrobiaceae bacterium]